MVGSDRWGERTLQDDHWVRVDFGPLAIVVLRRNEEWRVVSLAEDHKDLPPGGHVEELPEDLPFQRWDNDPKDSRFCFRPTYPTLPVVARPTTVLNISPKGRASFHIGVPAFIEVLAECQGAMTPLTEFPVTQLSKTWHGIQTSGRLGFALKTFARRVFEPEKWPEYDIICSIRIVNDGEEMLPFDRLFLETDHLSVFEAEGRLFSNAASIRDGATEGELTSVTYAAKPSQPHRDATEITPPRKGKVRRSMVHDTFSKVFGSLNLADD